MVIFLQYLSRTILLFMVIPHFFIISRAGLSSSFVALRLLAMSTNTPSSANTALPPPMM